MKRQYLIYNPSNKILVIFFTGWSTDFHIAEDIYLPEGYDFLCVWGYDKWDWEPLEKEYDEILIIAWSLGVAVADFLFPIINIENNVTGLYAINGTRNPVDENYGIPPMIFQSTIDTLDEKNLLKFRMRICGGKEKYRKEAKKLNTTSNIETLKKELDFFMASDVTIKRKNHWDYAFLSESDKIFPIQNLKIAWADTPFNVMEDENHLIDFQRIFDLIVKDKRAISRKFEKSLSTYDANAEVQKKTALSLLSMLRMENREFKKILEIGGGSGFLTKRIRELFPSSDLTVIDIGNYESVENAKFIKADAENIIKSWPASTFDLIISGSTFQWFHSPGKMLSECKRVLKNGGICAFSTYIFGTFKELSRVTGSSLLFLTEFQWNLLAMRAGLEITNSKSEENILLFESITELFRHLKSTGVNTVGGKTKTVGEIKKLMNNYLLQDEKYPLTYDSLIMILKSPC